MEFKGTQGKWEVRGNKLFIEDTYKSVATIHVVKNYKDVTFEPIEDVEQIANALLISKAPEMLDMIKELTELKSSSFLLDELQERAKQLLKEATEL